MLKNWQETCMTGSMLHASEKTSMTSNEVASRLTYELVPVEGDGPFLPASEDEMMEVEHLLAEPINEKVSVDAVFRFGKENPEKCLGIEDFPGPVDHNNHLKTGYDALLSDITREWSEESNFGVRNCYLDGMFQGGYEEDFHVTNGLSSACDDFLLDTEFVEKVSDLDYGKCEGPRSGNLGFESCSTVMREYDAGGVDTLELSATTIPVTESTSDRNVLLLNKMTIHELHDAFRSTFGRDTTVKDKQWLIRRISFGLQNFLHLENVSSLLESGISCKKQDGEMLFVSSNGSPKMYSLMGSKGKPIDRSVLRDTLAGMDVYNTNYSESNDTGFGILSSRDREDTIVTQKRLRKPTRRYIEETSDLKSRYSSGKLDAPLTGSKDKVMLARLYNQNHRKGYKATSLIRKPDSVVNSNTQVPFSIRMQRRHLKEYKSVWERDTGNNKNDRLLLDPSHSSDLGPSPAESLDDMSDDCVSTVRTAGDRIHRKRHRLWTLSEVMKLVDGVSQYGVGRWTDIKRLLFSSSAYRTSVDLKDKWRNLLRASNGAQLENKREVELGRKGASHLIPQSVLRRVSELAIIYPYPRERKSKLPPKLTSMSTVATPNHAAASSDDASVSCSGRIVRRKNFT